MGRPRDRDIEGYSNPVVKTLRGKWKKYIHFLFRCGIKEAIKIYWQKGKTILNTLWKPRGSPLYCIQSSSDPRFTRDKKRDKTARTALFWPAVTRTRPTTRAVQGKYQCCDGRFRLKIRHTMMRVALPSWPHNEKCWSRYETQVISTKLPGLSTPHLNGFKNEEWIRSPYQKEIFTQ